MPPPGLDSENGLPTIWTRARASLRRATSFLGSPGRRTVGSYSSAEELHLNAVAGRELALALGHAGQCVGAEHGGEDVGALLLRGLRVPAVVAHRQPAAD